MNRRPWTAEDDAQLRDLYPRTRTSELPVLLDRSRLAIKCRSAALHLRKNDDANMRRPWHSDEDAVIRMLYADTPTDAIAAQLVDRTASSVWQRARRLRLKKDPAYLASEAAGRIQRGDHKGRECWFKKGQAPANKGLKRPKGWAPGRMRETQFKKGVRQGVATKLWKPIGTERVSKDGYRERKINDGLPLQKRWRAVHLLVWEAANGTLPESHAVTFKNGDKTDIRLDNLELVSRADWMRRHSVHNLPPELKSAVRALGTLKSVITKRSKREEQNRRSA